MKSCVAEYLNSVKSQITEVDVEQLAQCEIDNALILDVREPQEHEQGMIPSATPLPRGVLEFKLFDLPQLKGLSEEEAHNKPIFIYCASGGRSACAALTLQNLGFKQVVSVAGGYKQWTESGRETV